MNLVAITAMRTRAAFDVAANPIAPAEGEPVAAEQYCMVPARGRG
jgi:hypothetical protein